MKKLVMVGHDVAILALCLMLWAAARSPVSSPVTLLLGMRIPVSFLVCHQPKLTVKPRANARSSSPVVDKPPPFCPSAFRGMYPLFSPSDFFITRRHRLLLLCLLGMVSQLVPKSARLRLLRAFTSRSWIHSELVMFLWSGVNTCVATTTRRQEVWLSPTFLRFLSSTRCWHGPEHIRSRCVT